MRRPVFRADEPAALRLFDLSPTFELASTTPDGEPVLRTLHGVMVDGVLCWHGSPVGEKSALAGRRGVAAVSRAVVTLPSYFSDAERACPATTLYRSAQIHGTVRELTEERSKARVLEALMRKLQPEGGYAPLDPEDARFAALYRKPVAKIAIYALDADRVTGKDKLLQHKSPVARREIIERIWRRGDPGDGAAVEELVAELDPRERPPWLSGPDQTSLHLAPTRAEARAAAELLKDAYWNQDFTTAELADAHLGSQAWVVARDPSGQLCATARAVTDGQKRAWVYDVITRPDWRGRGVGRAVMRLLLDHPAVRRVRVVHLGTKDAMDFYRGLGFVERSSVRRPYESVEMMRARRGDLPSPTQPHDLTA